MSISAWCPDESLVFINLWLIPYLLKNKQKGVAQSGEFTYNSAPS